MYVGINPKYQLSEVDHVIDDAKPTLLFAAARTEDRDFGKELEELGSRSHGPRIVPIQLDNEGPMGLPGFIEEGKHLPSAHAETLSRHVLPSDPITLVYTSGTTGKPKGALLTQQGFAHNYRRAFEQRYMDWLRVPAYFTINHLAGLGDIAALAIVAGGSQYFMQRFDPVTLLALIQRERLTYLPGLVTHFQLLFRVADLEQYDLSSIEYIWWGGALIPEALLRRFLEICPRASTDFGQTETHGPLIYTPVDASIEQKIQTIGRLTDPHVVRIADERGVEVRPGEPGEIQAHGTQISPGYWNNPEATARLYTADGWLRTGDLAIQRDDGYVEMIGRISEMFKSGGYNVYPAEIESVLGEVPEVDMVAVVSVSDPVYQEVGVAFATLKPGVQKTPKDLLAYARSKLANYKIPKSIFIVDEMPRTPVGKIDKPALRAQALRHPANP
jgi:fatty-acyl-CoA synthase